MFYTEEREGERRKEGRKERRKERKKERRRKVKLRTQHIKKKMIERERER